MSQTLIKVLAGVGFAGIAVALSVIYEVGRARELVITAIRAIVQLAAVGAIVTAVFEAPALAALFVAVMAGTAALTAGARLREIEGARRRALLAIALPALSATGILLAAGAFDLTARSIVPTAGILIGGAMAATTLTGRRLVESLREERDDMDARLALGDSASDALQPAIRRAVYTGLVPVIDQTRSVGLVALPGTFVGLILGGASPVEAAATQLVVLLTLLAVELAAGLLLAELTKRAVILPGERIAVIGHASR